MEPICGHTYTRTSGRTAQCRAKPHPRKPDAHYFVWLTKIEAGQIKTKDRRVRRGLVIVPGDLP